MIDNTTLKQLVHKAIQSSPHVSRERLRFETHEGKVVLQGNLRSYFQKQMAQEALREVEGVTEIENQIEVSW